MKTIGVIGAMEEEVELLKNMLSDVTSEECAGLKFYIGNLADKKVVLCQSGMGKVAAAAATQVLCTKYQIDAMINSGIAGNMTAKIGVGDVVLSKEVTYHDAEIGMIKKAYPYMESYMGDERLLKAALIACQSENVKAIQGKIATGDLFVGEKQLKDKIKAFCNPDCVEMEGAAVAHISCKNNVPFLIIRAMSDNADEAAKQELVVKQFDTSEYSDKAAHICAKTIENMQF